MEVVVSGGSTHDVINGSTNQRSRGMEVVTCDGSAQSRMEAATSGSNQIPSHDDDSMSKEPQNMGFLKVYTRRKFRSQAEAPEGTPTATSEQCSPNPPNIVDDVSSTSGTEIEDPFIDDLPIALRKETRAKAGIPASRYGFDHDISNYVSYASLSSAYRAFVTSLQSITIPRDWKEANQDPK